MGTTEAAARVRAHRALKDLRSALGPNSVAEVPA
jgi:hypothetical protein